MNKEEQINEFRKNILPKYISEIKYDAYKSVIDKQNEKIQKLRNEKYKFFVENNNKLDLIHYYCKNFLKTKAEAMEFININKKKQFLYNKRDIAMMIVDEILPLKTIQRVECEEE